MGHIAASDFDPHLVMEGSRKMRLAVHWQVGEVNGGLKAHNRPLMKPKHTTLRWITVTVLTLLLISLYVLIGVDEVFMHTHTSLRNLQELNPAGRELRPIIDPTVSSVLPGLDPDLKNTTIQPSSSMDQNPSDPNLSQEGHAIDEKCKGRSIFIYDLPPQFNKYLVEDCKNWTAWVDMCEDLSNEGFGAQVELPSRDPMGYILRPRHAWFRTDQSNLEVMFHERMKTYPCLTQNPKDATMYYIPFYPALDLTRNLRSPSIEVRDALSHSLIDWLQVHPQWKQLHGHRHVMVLGRIVWDFFRKENNTGWGNALLSLPGLQNSTKLLVERNIWDNDMMAIPYPTSFHPTTDADIRAWQATVRTSERMIFASFAGSCRNRDMNGTVRGEVFQQCANSSICNLVVCTHERCVRQPQTITGLYLRSVFCLQPPGDSVTRKGIFDSLIAGCIPVLFDEKSALYQYLWHLPRNGSEYSVSIPGVNVTLNHYNVMEHLARIPNATVRRMQHTIIEMLPQLVYRKPGIYNHSSKFDSRDAFDISIDALLEKFKLEDEQSVHVSDH